MYFELTLLCPHSQIGTGFTDELLDKHHQFFKDHVISQPKAYYRYDDSLAPDHWFDAVQVNSALFLFTCVFGSTPYIALPNIIVIC